MQFIPSFCAGDYNTASNAEGSKPVIVLSPTTITGTAAPPMRWNSSWPGDPSILISW